MSRLMLLTLVGLLGLSLAGCVAVGGRDRVHGSGTVTAEERDVAPFTAVNVSGIGELVIVQGEAEHLTVETDDNLHAVVVSEVRDGTLYLDFSSDVIVVSLSRIGFTLSVKGLERITLSGAATVHVQDLDGPQYNGSRNSDTRPGQGKVA